jgi:dienelactone hydrolase
LCKASEREFFDGGGTTIITKKINYLAGKKTMTGYLALPDGEGPFPGVLVVHEWWGQTDFPRERARKLAQAGYAALAVDMYGDGKTAEHPKDAKDFSSKVMADMEGAEISFRAALDTLKKQDRVKKDAIAALGYCFGGGVVLEMARRGVELDLVASFHGDLSPIVKNQVGPIKSRILIFNGGADPMVPAEAVASAKSHLKAAKVRFKLVTFKNAKHGFTNPMATEKGTKFGLPLAYDPKADKRSWDDTMSAFKVVFK